MVAGCLELSIVSQCSTEQTNQAARKPKDNRSIVVKTKKNTKTRLNCFWMFNDIIKTYYTHRLEFLCDGMYFVRITWSGQEGFGGGRFCNDLPFASAAAVDVYYSTAL